MQLFDRVPLAGSATITKEGYLVADAYVARANNIQEYFASELGLKDRQPNDVIRVFRPEKVVFGKDALDSAARVPVTIDHPSAMVDAKNYRELARGFTGDEILRDGEKMRIPFRVTDAAAVEALATTHQEFSWGYAADMDFTPGTFNGAAYDAAITSLEYNHLAACRAARGGPELRIVDQRTIPTEKPKMKITIGDAKDVDLSDGAAVALAVGALNTTLADAQTKVGTLTADLATATTAIQTKDGEIAALNQKVTDSAITPEKLQALADARADVVSKAKTLAPNIVTDGKSDADIRKEAVTAKLGDAAKDMADAAIEGAFIAFTKDAVTDPVRDAFRSGLTVVTDGRTAIAGARATWLADKATAHRAPAA